jgi:hypothetical protein
VVFTGLAPLPGSPASTPVIGAGTRMMWYAGKAAFRSGNVSGNQWNKDSIGIYSSALGLNTKAKGEASVAMGSGAEALSIAAIALGINTKASGLNSFAAGDGSIASGTGSVAIGTQNQSTSINTTAIGNGSVASVNFATAIGYQNMATGLGSLAMGYQSGAPGTIATSLGEHTRARGDNTLAIGNFTTARPYASLVMGQYNDTSSISFITWNPNDPVFIIGNGSDENNRSNAITILKNAKTGINTTTPDAMLHVVRDAATNGLYNSAATAIFEGDQGSFIQLSSDATMQSGVLAGSELTSLRSAMIFMPDSSIQLRAGGGTTRLFVRKDGNIGIGTLAPQRLLHISDGPGGNMYFGGAEMIIEDDAASYLQFSSPNTFESGILSGNNLTSIRSGLIFRPDSSLHFRTGGNVTKMLINTAGDVGIGDNSPNARLHVSNGTGGNVYNAEADLIIEDNTHAYLQFSTPVNQEAGIFSGNATMDIRSSIRFKSDSSIVATTGGSSTRLTISKAGNVAIGSASPGARLDVQGTAIIGSNGTVLTEIIKLTVLSDIPNVAANSTVTETFPVANATVGSSVYISPSSAFANGLIMAYARVSAAGTVEAKFTNTTVAAINPSPMDFYITVIR